GGSARARVCAALPGGSTRWFDRESVMSFQIRPKLRGGLRTRLPQLVAGLVVSVAAATAGADQLTTPPAPTASEQANRPTRGMSMDKVEATFGAPAQRS